MCHCTDDSAEVALTDRSTRGFQNQAKRQSFWTFCSVNFSEKLAFSHYSRGHQFLPALYIFAAGAPVDVVCTVLHHPHTDTNDPICGPRHCQDDTQDGWKQNLQSLADWTLSAYNLMKTSHSTRR